VTSRRRWALIVLAVLVVAAGIGRLLVARQAAGSAAAPRAAPAAATAALELTPGDVASASVTELVATLALSGSLRAVDSALVKAKVASEVREVLVREGDAVRAGQLIARLDDTEVRWRLRQAEDHVAAAQAQLDVASRQQANNQALVEQGFISRNALETSVSNAAGAQATLQAARAAAEITRKAVRDTEIRAPLSGLVSQRLVQPGERVAVDARLLEIVDLSRLELEVAVAPEDVVALRVGQPARVSVDGVALPVTARVARINPSTQVGTRSVLAYLAVEPQPGLRQGLFGRAVIDLQRRSTLVVPLSAVRFDQARPMVTTVAGGQARQRDVTLGARGEATFGGTSEAAVEMLSGLTAGEIVLRGPVGTLRDGTPLRLPGAPAASPAASPAPASAPSGTGAAAAAAAR
jgi:RND family efflux transporter MFP subunit